MQDGRFMCPGFVDVHCHAPQVGTDNQIWSNGKHTFVASSSSIITAVPYMFTATCMRLRNIMNVFENECVFEQIMVFAVLVFWNCHRQAANGMAG